MRTLAITQNITLDGKVEMLGDWFDPAVSTDEGGRDVRGIGSSEHRAEGRGTERSRDTGEVDDHLAENRRQRERADGFLCGRRTFTDLRGYWRDLADDTTGVSDYLNAVSKHVVSSTLGDPEWDRTAVIDPTGAGGDLETQVRALKEGSDGGSGDIVVTGSITLCHALIAAGLVDEYRFFTYPVVQGAGRALFPDGYEASGLRPLHQRTFRSGITFASWAAR